MNIIDRVFAAAFCVLNAFILEPPGSDDSSIDLVDMIKVHQQRSTNLLTCMVLAAIIGTVLGLFVDEDLRRLNYKEHEVNEEKVSTERNTDSTKDLESERCYCIQ